MYQYYKRKVYVLLHPEIGNTWIDKAFNAFIIFLIILNVIAVSLETVSSIHERYKTLFNYFDTFSVIIFTIEYVLRVWSSNSDFKYRHSITGRIKYMFSLGALIDLLAILPFYLHSFMGFDLRVLRMFRLLRFLRLFHLTSYMKATQMVINVFRSTKNQLLISLMLTVFLIIISSCLIYFAEHLAQPKVFASIPETIWWSVVTLSTVGYGDMIPITIFGKIMTIVIMLTGVALLALPAGILTAGFLDEMRKDRKRISRNCPHCGLPIENEN